MFYTKVFYLVFSEPKNNLPKVLNCVIHLSCFWRVLSGSQANKLIVTARKRSLGQGNVFTPVCQSVCSRGVLWCHFCYGQHHPLDSTAPPDSTPPPAGPHPFPVNKWAVRILLEYFLVLKNFIKCERGRVLRRRTWIENNGQNDDFLRSYCWL